MPKPVVRRTESHVQCQVAGTGGSVLFRRGWLPPEPERALLLVHGYAEHSGRYEELGTWFAARGCAVHAYDHQGHGRSTGTRCHVARFDDYVDDLHRVLDLVRAEHPGLPITLVGHSMGALISLTFLAARKPAIAGAVISAPPLLLGPGVSRSRKTMAGLLRKLMPRFKLGSGFEPEGLSRDPEVVKRYLEDPFVYRTMTASLASELLTTVPATAARASEVRVPVLMLHGADDPICAAAGSRAFHSSLAVAGCDLRIYPKLRHEIFNEPEWEQVAQDAFEWIRGLEL